MQQTRGKKKTGSLEGWRIGTERYERGTKTSATLADAEWIFVVHLTLA